ncbi:MAG: hypothetical protein A2V72_02905 [Candidatus Nealsonbacteria bacterium RBG_13_37_56]|uniref:Uncharacterized protein n=1 Tax=Candidatus Nealsonbacteria bacterium RBG_13_37_56 TaxID=1801661 RepID=A0A1G2DXU6_9BACT|nr:MAG: hypothetical protein A2V72_02905 [Candidatus Nealsonbacteria bacterium RBG_13_37_56]
MILFINILYHKKQRTGPRLLWKKGLTGYFKGCNIEAKETLLFINLVFYNYFGEKPRKRLRDLLKIKDLYFI